MDITWVAHTVSVVFPCYFLTRDMSIQCAGVSLVQVGAFASTASAFGSLFQAVSATGASAGALSVGGTALCDGSSRNALHCSGNSSGASSLVQMAPVVVQAINACPAQVQVCAFLGMGTIVRADNGCTFLASSNVTINSGSCRYGQALVESCCVYPLFISLYFYIDNRPPDESSLGVVVQGCTWACSSSASPACFCVRAGAAVYSFITFLHCDHWGCFLSLGSDRSAFVKRPMWIGRGP